MNRPPGGGAARVVGQVEARVRLVHMARGSACPVEI
jgi:hypothetical protein